MHRGLQSTDGAVQLIEEARRKQVLDEDKAQLLPNWHVSGISRIHERPDNHKLIAFRRAIEDTLVLALNPALVSAVSAGKQPVTIPHPDCSDVSDWLLQIWNAQAVPRQDAEKSLSENGLPSFRALEFVPAGDAKIVHCIFQSGRSTIKFRLDELSSGQIALIVLEAAVAVANHGNGVLLLDEPGNFLALAEIQPLLTRLQDAAMEQRFQVILTAHNPIAIDFLAWSPDRHIKGCPPRNGFPCEQHFCLRAAKWIPQQSVSG